ncbi:thiamine biosynthesis lipoprotein [Lachnotalea glycerini]|uniref:FAD:protein FMN transferase n=1 Tax=Lachnotalea glycerini TaxID=1763509 RepID=A0A318ERU7_9FIRM|nr:FAD:protein FMN transferase [Lachnotalea glycerini]PXV91069.1 thiamine biosynthesis lipoprotein [Lachnotalea glycerini]
MAKRVLSIFLLWVMTINLTACSGTKESRYEASFLELFDTVTTIVGYAENKDEFTKYVQIIYNQLSEYHQLYNIYNDYEGINNIKTINDNAGISPVKVNQKIIDLLKFSKKAYEETNGKTNIALGSVLSVWHDYRTRGIEDPENAQLPPMDLLEEKFKHTDINNIIINEEESTVYIQDSLMSIDVGAIAKGYAVEAVSQYIEEQGFTHAVISVGGNVRALGTKIIDGKEQAWSAGIQNPDSESENTNLYILNLKDYSLVTSGVYQRYYTVDGKEYHHIINPSTLMPADYFLSVSIVCKESGNADALSTAVFNMPYEDGVTLIESLEETEALWVFKDGSMKYSSGFDKFIK